MQDKLISILTKPGEIEWQINNFNCPNHNNDKPCNIKVDISIHTPHSIHHINFNYTINNYEAYCDRLPSRKNKILNYCANLDTSYKGNDCIKVDKQIVYKIGLSYITHGLLLYLNQLTLDTDYKMWGMFYFINYHIFYIYLT